MVITKTWQIAKATLSQFMSHRAMQLGAALAFYSIFSLAPILVIIIAIAGAVYGRRAVEGKLIGQIEASVGTEAAELIQEIIRGANETGPGTFTIIMSIAITIVAATGVFVQLKASLNVIWNVQPKPKQPILSVLRNRMFSFGMVLLIAAVLLTSMIANTYVTGMTRTTADIFGMPAWTLSIARYVLAIAIFSVLFAIVFKFLPDIRARWRDVWVGSLGTAVLFVIGESAIGVYFAYGSAGSVYGAAGSLVALLMWIYYCSLIVLFGAEFTQVYTNRVGHGAEPGKHAVSREREAGRA